MPRRGSLASHLTSAAKQFEKRQVAHYRDGSFSDAAADLVVGAVQGMAASILRSGSAMVHGPKPEASDLSAEFAHRLATQLLALKGPPKRLATHVELEIARSLTLATDAMAERCFELARMALPDPPGEAVSRFLQRLGRCYIAGFFPESVIVCRAVLENAVLEKFEREGKPLPVPTPGKSEMRARLIRAEEHGWLTRKQYNDAWSVWERGSKAAHRDPQVTSAVLETISTTVALLRVLYG